MNLPEQLDELRDSKVWINYCILKGAGGRLDKPPINPNTLRNGRTDSQESWTDFDTANANIGRTANIYYNGQSLTVTVSGVGIVLEPAGLVGIDIDDGLILDEVGNIKGVKPETQRIWRIVDSYTEISVSRTGIHILCYGKKPGGACKAMLDGVELEMYDCGRYFTISGNALPWSNSIRQNPEAVKQVYSLICERQRLSEPTAAATTEPTAAGGDNSLCVVSCKEKTVGGHGRRRPAPATDDEVLYKMFHSARGDENKRLFNGDISAISFDGKPNTDWSRADRHFCISIAYWINNESAERIDRIFRRSRLYRPHKWDEIHKVVRNEDGNPLQYYTYGQLTIAEALRKNPTYLEYTEEEKAQYRQRKEAEEQSMIPRKENGILDWNDWIDD